jgi:Uncharacterized phage-associated protein
MTTAMEVLRYMRSLGHDFSGEVQAQKLLYYAQAWSLAWDGAPLFDDAVEAWEKGPVVRNVRYRLPVTPQDSPLLSSQQKANVQAVLAHYGRMTGRDLSELSHSESPWKITRARGTAEVISHELMQREYAGQSAHGRGPHRSVVAKATAPDVGVLAAAGVAADRWSRTLAILAE